MSVLAIAFSFPPKSSSGAIRNVKMLKYLPENGWDVFVLTVHEKYFMRINEGDEKTLKQISKSLKLIRTKCFFTEEFLGNLSASLFLGRKKSFESETPKDAEANAEDSISVEDNVNASKSTAQKIKDFVTDLLTIPDKYVGWIPFAVWDGIKTLRKNPVDIIYAIGKPWSAFFVGYALKVIFRKPLVIDFMDPWKASTWRPSKMSFLEHIQTFLEKFIVTRADFVIANTDELAQDFIKRLGIPRRRVDVLTCGYDESDLNGEYRQKPNHKFNITHTGSFYKKRNPVNFLKAVKILIEKELISSDKIGINFIGSISVKDPELHQLLADPILKEFVHLISWVPHNKAIEYLHQSDVLLLVQPGTYLQIPAKLYEYVALQKPIIALAEENGAVGNIIRREGWGETINNENIEKISQAVSRYYEQYLNGKLESINYNHEAYRIRNLSARLGRILHQTITEKDTRI